MPIATYEILQPSTSAEVAQLALQAPYAEDIALKGLLHLVVRAKDIEDAPEQTLLMSMRVTTFDDFSNVQTVAGRGMLDADTSHSVHSDSVKITLAPEGHRPALVSAVLPDDVQPQ